MLAYVDAHLEDALSVEHLSGVAAFSKYHFHRQFTGLFGMAVSKYVQLVRMKRASYQLAYREHVPVMEIALASGYAGPEAFARAFRKSMGQSPSEFRRQPEWDPWHETYQPLSDVRSTHMKPAKTAHEVRIVNFKETRVAAFEHRGDPRWIGNSIRSFIQWRKQNALPPRISATFNIVYDNPAEVAPADHRFDLCAETDRDIEPNPQGVVAKTIPAGRCAVLRHIGSDDTLPDTVMYLYSEWLPRSGEEPRDFPLYFQRVEFFPDVPEHEAVTDVFLPLSAR